MKKIVISIFVATMACLCPVATQAGTSDVMITVNDTVIMPLTDIIGLGLPLLYIETVDSEEPTCEYVSAPSGCMGKTIRNATKVPGRMVMYQRINGLDSVLYDSGNYEDNVSGMTIKLRGNTTAYEPKKPYKIKLQKKFDLLMGGNDAVYKDKEWLLLRDDYLTTIAGFKISEMVGMVWVPRYHFVNVVMNGTYRGVYLLCESVKRNPDCRLNVDKNTGFIFECDPYWWNENVYVYSERNPSYNYTFKYPDDEDITEEQLTYMQSLVTAFEASQKKFNYPDMIDVRSFAAWCLVHDITGTKDSGGSNRYYTKYDTTAASKIVMPLAWDFDMAEHVSSTWSKSHTSHMTNLFNNANRTYVGTFVEIWYGIRLTMLQDITDFLTQFGQSEEGVGLNASFAINKLVYGTNLTVSTDVNARKSWYRYRYPWLDNAVLALIPRGDVNLDGSVDVADVTSLIDMILTGEGQFRCPADMDLDGTVGISDVTLLIDKILGAN